MKNDYADRSAVRALPFEAAVGSSGLVLVRRFDERGAWSWTEHVHDEHQLVWAARPVTVQADGREWLVLPSCGLWIPAGIRHAVTGRHGSTVYCAYVDAAGCSVRWPGPTMLVVTGFLREAIVRLSDAELSPAERTRTEAVVFDVLHPAETAGLSIPLPIDQGLRRIAATLLACPGDMRSLNQWAYELNVGVRTQSRRFRAQTGMSFVQWRRVARVRAGIALLADGAPMAKVVRVAGYTTPSAFAFAVRGVTGESPRGYGDRDRFPPC